MFHCVNFLNKSEVYFSNPKTWMAWAVINLHDYLMFFIINIFVVVIFFLIICLSSQSNFFLKKNNVEEYLKGRLDEFNHAPNLEFFWTIVPIILLFIMGWPSFRALFAVEQLIDPYHTIIIIGNQWYWTYQYSDFDIASDVILQLDSRENFEIIKFKNVINFESEKNMFFDFFFDFNLQIDNLDYHKFFNYLGKYLRKFEESKLLYDSVIISDENLPLGYPRLLSADQVLVLPNNVSIRILVTSSDVIHSWALPSHGVKMDAIPGRINQIAFVAPFWGTYRGQCSELCGINHGFMPIEIVILNFSDYLDFLKINVSFRYDKFFILVKKFVTNYHYFDSCIKLKNFFLIEQNVFLGRSWKFTNWWKEGNKGYHEPKILKSFAFSGLNNKKYAAWFY